MNSLFLFGASDTSQFSENNLVQLGLREGLAPDRLPTTGGFASFFECRRLNQMALSPDRRYLAMISGKNDSDRVLLFDTDTDDYLQYPERFAQGNIAYMGVTLSNTHIALYSEYAPYLQLLTLPDLELVASFNSGLVGYCTNAAFSPDGSKLAVLAYGREKPLREYDLTQPNFPFSEAEQAFPATYSSLSYPMVIAYSPSGDKLMLFQSGYFQILFNVADLSVLKNWGASGIQYGYKQCLWIEDSVYSINSSTKAAVLRSKTTDDYALSQLPPIKRPDGIASYPNVYDLAYDEQAQRVYLWHQPVYSGERSKVFALSWFDPTLETPEMHPITAAQCPASLHYTSSSGSLLLLQKNLGEVRGTVRDVDNAPAARLVRAFNRQSGRLVAQTMSDALTGNYKMTLPDTQPVDVVFQSAQGELLNDLIFAKAIPDAL